MNFNITREQVNTGIRWFVTTFGAMLAGYFVAWGFGTQESFLQLLNNPMIQYAVGSLILAIAPLIQGLISKTEKNQVAATEALPNVKTIQMKSTDEGKAIADALPNTVTVAPHVVSPVSGGSL